MGSEKEITELKNQVSKLNSRIDMLSSQLEKSIELITAYGAHEKLMFWALYKNENEELKDAKKRFFSTLKTENSFLKLKQRGNLILLKHFISVCERENLTYWIDFGTILGAARHGGFIPWDDDIDVTMPRKDYNRFLELMKDDGTYTLTHWYMTSSDFRITKLIYKESPHLFFLDIFPSDESEFDTERSNNIYYEHNSRIASRLSEFNKKRGNAIVSYDIFIDGEAKAELERIFSEEINDYINALHPNKSEPVKCYVPGVDNPSGNMNMIKSTDVNDIFPLSKTKFESASVNIMNGFEKRLERCYGDWLSLPNDIFTHQHVKSPITKEEIDRENRFLDKFQGI